MAKKRFKIFTCEPGKTQDLETRMNEWVKSMEEGNTFDLVGLDVAKQGSSSVNGVQSVIVVVTYDLMFEKARTDFEVVINGVKKTLNATEITYQEIVALAATGRNAVHSVTYRARKEGIQGILAPGEKVKLVEGMVFNAMVTDNA
jgi:hypothetical protein